MTARNTASMQAQRRRLAVVAAEAVLERVAVDEQQDRHGRVGRTAAGEQVRLEEHLGGPDDLQDEGDEQDAAQLRHRDVPDLAPDAGAVDLGRVVQLGRDGGQRGEVDDHGAAGGRPGGLEHERRHRPRRALQPGLGRDADPAEDRVEHALGPRVVEELPQQHRDDRRHDDRQVGERRVEPLAAAHLAHEHGGDERDRVAEDERQQREVQRCCGSAMGSSGSAKTCWKFSQAHPGRDDEVRLLEAHHDGADDRQPGEDPEDHEQRQREHQRGQPAAAHPGERGAAAAGARASRTTSSVVIGAFSRGVT